MSGMEKLSDLLEMAKVSDIIATKKEKEDNKIVWALAIIGAIAAVAGIAFANPGWRWRTSSLPKTLMMILTMISSMKKMIRM